MCVTWPLLKALQPVLSCVTPGIVRLDMQVPRGYVCNQVNDLLVAFRLLTDGQEDASVWLKPTRSSQGVILVTSANELKYYDFPLGDVIMQENLWNNNEDTKSDNQALSDLQISPCVQYSGSAILEGDLTALPHSCSPILQVRLHLGIHCTSHVNARLGR